MQAQQNVIALRHIRLVDLQSFFCGKSSVHLRCGSLNRTAPGECPVLGNSYNGTYDRNGGAKRPLVWRAKLRSQSAQKAGCAHTQVCSMSA